jgi:intein/homing endonuclease
MSVGLTSRKNFIMNLEYILEREDFLELQLFIAFRSDTFKKTLLGGLIVLSIIILIFTIYEFVKTNDILVFIVYFIVLLIILFLYNYLLRGIYKYLIQKNIAGVLNNRFGNTEYVEIRENVIKIKSLKKEADINISQIVTISETKKYFFIELSSGNYILIPKFKISNPDEVRHKFESFGININTRK